VTGFNTWLQEQTRLPQINNSRDVLALMATYRSKQRQILPTYGQELAEYRQQRKRPAGRIVVTDDATVAGGLLDLGGADYPLLIDGFRVYNFAPVYGLPVLYLMPNEFWALDVAHQIAEAHPSAYALVWPHSDVEEVLWN
jgi:hypothetical protein